MKELTFYEKMEHMVSKKKDMNLTEQATHILTTYKNEIRISMNERTLQIKLTH